MNEEEDLTENGNKQKPSQDFNAELSSGFLKLEGPTRERDERAAFLHFLKAADQGNCEAHARLAAMYKEGTGTVSSLGQALHHALLAAISGDPEGQFRLGCLYLTGDGIIPDENQALQWILKAAEQRWPEAEFQLGLFYARGKLVTQDWNMAAKLFEKAAQKQFPSAQHALGYMYWKGLGVTVDLAKAAELTRNAAEKDHAGAQYQLYELLSATVQEDEQDEAQDILYFVGRASDLNSEQNEVDEEPVEDPGLSESIDETDMPYFWLVKAAQNNYAPAQYRVFCLLQADSDQPIEKINLDWLEQAAENGLLEAQYELGRHYMSKAYHRDTPLQSFLKKAIYWFGKARQNGHAKADEYFKWIYQERSFANNGFSDTDWTEVFAEGGHAGAQYKLGWACFLGVNMPKDTARGVSLLQAAAGQGHKTAQGRLAVLFEVGDGVPKDSAQAIYWQKMAETNEDAEQTCFGQS